MGERERNGSSHNKGWGEGVGRRRGWGGVGMSTARRLSVLVGEQESGDNSGQAHVTLHSLSALLAESDPRYRARRTAAQPQPCAQNR